MNTLMIHSGGIGDFLLTCPAIEQLSKTQSITLAGSPNRLNLALTAGIAKKVLPLDSIRFDSVYGAPAKLLIDTVRNFDTIIVWMNDPDRKIATTLQDITPATIQVFPGLPPQHWNRHASEYYAECLGLSNVQPFRFRPPPATAPHDIILHPGSGSPKKNWPVQHFITLAQKLEAAGRNVTWAIGPAEKERGNHDRPGPQLECDSLTDLATELQATALYIGNDSGITHLAAAVGTPTLTIFGPTNPDIWAPHGATVVRSTGSTPWPTVDHVYNALPKPGP